MALLRSGIHWAAGLPIGSHGTDGAAREGHTAAVYVDPIDLAKVKDRLAAGDGALVAALAELRGQANKELKAGPFSIVTNNKPRLAPSGDKHDYVEHGPLFLARPRQERRSPLHSQGRPSQSRARKIQHTLTGQNGAGCAFAGPDLYLTGEQAYAEHAAELLRGWYLERATRMNPKPNFGQFILGITDGRGIGIIDTVR